MRSPLHIALGDISDDCLRVACRARGMPGAAFGIPDDLSHGPLDDGRARIDYMRDRFCGYDDWCLDVADALAGDDRPYRRGEGRRGCHLER
jgi:hypothetical protein